MKSSNDNLDAIDRGDSVIDPPLSTDRAFRAAP